MSKYKELKRMNNLKDVVMIEYSENVKQLGEHLEKYLASPDIGRTDPPG